MFKKILLVIAVIFMANNAQADLIAYYDFEQDEDGIVYDVSGNGNHASLDDNAPIYYNINSHLSYPGVAPDYAYWFDGDYIKLPININPANYSKVTFGAWVSPNTENLTSKNVIISHDNGGYDRTLTIDNRGGNNYSAFTGSGVFGSEPPSGSGDWDFVAVVYDSEAKTVNLFVNGTLYETKGNPGNGRDYVLLGVNPIHGNSEFFAGGINNVFFFDEALSEDQLNDIMANGVMPVPVPSTLFLLSLGVFTIAGLKRMF